MIKVQKFANIQELQLFLNGGLLGGNIGLGIVGLVGKTMTFSAPAGTVTFVTASRYNDALTLVDIKTQIEAALNVANIKVISIYGRIGLVHPTAASAIVLDGTDQPAKALLGFNANDPSTGKLYGVAIGTPPALVSITPTIDNSYIVTTVE